MKFCVDDEKVKYFNYLKKIRQIKFANIISNCDIQVYFTDKILQESLYQTINMHKRAVNQIQMPPEIGYIFMYISFKKNMNKKEQDMLYVHYQLLQRAPFKLYICQCQYSLTFGAFSHIIINVHLRSLQFFCKDLHIFYLFI